MTGGGGCEKVPTQQKQKISKFGTSTLPLEEMHLGFRGGRRCGPPERIRRDCRTTFTTAGILRSCGYGYKSLYAVEVWYGPATMGGRGALEHGTPGMIFIANQPCRLVTIKRMIRVPNTEIGGTWK